MIRRPGTHDPPGRAPESRRILTATTPSSRQQFRPKGEDPAAQADSINARKRRQKPPAELQAPVHSPVLFKRSNDDACLGKLRAHLRRRG